MSEQDKRLVDERDALSVYFDALLTEEEAPVPAEAPLEATPEPEPLPLREPPALAPVLAPPVIATSEQPAEPVQEQAWENALETPVAPASSSTRPEWGEATFQALLFKVAGLTLAVPLVELSGIQEWDAEQVTPMPGHAPWYLGLMQYRDNSVPVVDTAHLVLPPDRMARLQSSAGERLGRVVFIDDGRWGLGCDAVAEVITLEPEQVSWRTSRAKRRWLAGTVIEQMCALIDPPAFAEMLATGIADEPGAAEDSSAELPTPGA